MEEKEHKRGTDSEKKKAMLVIVEWRAVATSF